MRAENHARHIVVALVLKFISAGIPSHAAGAANVAESTEAAKSVNPIAQAFECTAISGEPCTSVDALRVRAQAMINAGQSASAFTLVVSYESLYVGNPDYDYLLGVTALSARENVAAVHALERAVLVQPNYAGAWLDLAIAHFRLGETDTADALLKHVEESFDPPPGMLAQIAAVRRKFSSTRLKQVVRGWQSEVGLYVGHTTNANYGLSVSTIQLSLDGIPATLLLDPSFRPRADGFTELRGSASRAIQLDQGERADLHGLIRSRRYGSEGDMNQSEALASAIWRGPTTWLGVDDATRYAGASLRNLIFDGRSMTVGMLTGGIRVQRAKCSLVGRFDYEHRIYSGSIGLDAAIPWVGMVAECGSERVQYGVQQRVGFDKALQRRAGGDALRLESILYGRWQARRDLQVGANLVYAYARDSEPYSPILENGARRWLHRFAQKIEALWVPGGSPTSPWAIVIELENIVDRSNIGLSNVRVNQFTLGLSYRYF